MSFDTLASTGCQLTLALEELEMKISNLANHLTELTEELQRIEGQLMEQERALNDNSSDDNTTSAVNQVSNEAQASTMQTTTANQTSAIQIPTVNQIGIRQAPTANQTCGRMNTPTVNQSTRMQAPIPNRYAISVPTVDDDDLVEIQSPLIAQPSVQTIRRTNEVPGINSLFTDYAIMNDAFISRATGRTIDNVEINPEMREYISRRRHFFYALTPQDFRALMENRPPNRNMPLNRWFLASLQRATLDHSLANSNDRLRQDEIEMITRTLTTAYNRGANICLCLMAIFAIRTFVRYVYSFLRK